MNKSAIGRRHEDAAFDGMFARIVELASTVPLAALAWYNLQRRRTYHEVDMSGALQVEEDHVLSDLAAAESPWAGSLNTVSRQYRAAYHKSRVETYMGTDSKGHMKIKTRTVYYWDEPAGLPSHTTIEHHRSRAATLEERCKHLASIKSIDPALANNLVVKQNQNSTTFDGVTTVGVYGLLIAGLLGYEEAHAAIAHEGERTTIKERVMQDNTPAQLTRRSFLKIGATLAGAMVAYGVRSHNDEVCDEGKKTLKAGIDNTIAKTDVPPGVVFSQYFGKSPADIIVDVDTAVQDAESALTRGVAHQGVRDAFTNVVTVGKAHAAQLRTTFADGVPNDMGQAMAYALATESLEQQSGDAGSRAKTGLLLEGLAVTGVMAAVLVPGEIVNKKME